MQGFLLDYTSKGEVVRGSRWPPGDEAATVTVTRSTGWPVAATSWTWQLHFARSTSGGSPDLVLTNTGATISGNDIRITFVATSTQTLTLPGSGRVRFSIDLYSDDGASGQPSYWDPAQGEAWVRDKVGNVS